MNNDLEQWLKQAGLEQHAATFADNGIEMDVLALLSEDDLKELGLNLGDRRRLQKDGKQQSRFCCYEVSQRMCLDVIVVSSKDGI